MSAAAARALRPLFLPAVLLGAVALALSAEPVRRLWIEIGQVAPIVLHGLAMLLAARLRRARLAFASVAIASLLFATDRSGWPGAILPWSLLVLAVLPERPLLSLASLTRGVVALAPWLAAAVSATLPVPPGPVWIHVASAGALLLVVALRRKDTASAALLGGLCAGGLAAVADTSATCAGWVASAGLLFAVLVVQEAYRSAWHDGLTRLASRRALEEALTGLRGRFVVAMVDIDHFKRLNDRLGHDAGDQVLRLVAAHLRGAAGGEAFRYGGEEFTVVYRGARRAAGAERDLERLRQAIAAARFNVRAADRPRSKRRGKPMRGRGGHAGGVKVTVSVGAASSDGVDSAHEALARADKALYRAKRAGRDRVVIA